MKPARRFSLATAVSAVLHGALLVGGTCSLGWNLPEFDFELEFEEVELIDIDAEQGEEEAVEPPPMVDGPALPPDGLGPEPGEEEQPEPEPEKRFGDKSARVDKLAPTSSTFYMFMANRRLRKLPYSEDFLEAFSPQYDFQFLVDGGGFHPWNDFEYMLIASSNIADPTQNFIAVSHKLDQGTIKSGIERACRNFDMEIDWETREGKLAGNPRPKDPKVKDDDPRWFVIVDDSTAIYIREEFLAALDGKTEGDKKTARNFVANATRMKRYAAAEPNAGFTLVFKDLRSGLKKAKMPFPAPNDFEFMFEAAESPELLMKIEWPEADEAKQFESYFKEDLKKMINGDIKLKIVAGAFYNAFEIERTGKKVQLRGQLSASQAKSAAELMAGLARKLTETSDDEWQKSKAMRQKSFAERAEADDADEDATAPKAPAATGGDAAPAASGGAAPATGAAPSPKAPGQGETKTMGLAQPAATGEP